MKTTDLLYAIKIMLLVIAVGMVLFLVCSGGGRLTLLFDLLFTPFIWVFTLPMIGPIVFIITGLVLYAILIRHPSQGWKDNEKNLFILVLIVMVVGWLVSEQHAGKMFLLTCLVGVSYPIIQIVRIETKKIQTVMKLLK